MLKVSRLQQEFMQITQEQPLNFTIYPDMMVVSKEKLYSGMSKDEKSRIMIDNRSIERNGFMSDATKRKVRKILIAWLTAVRIHNDKLEPFEYRDKITLTFATLTLSDEQKHSDLFIKRNMLNRFLIKMQRDYEVNHYFWRAERMKNGRIHFHLILDHYVSNRELQFTWNEIQKEHNYIDNYYCTYGTYNPPSTHIRRIDSDEQAISYAIKYTTKQATDDESDIKPIKGLIWGCSDLLKKLTPYKCMEDSQLLNAVNTAIKDGVVDVIESDQYMLLKTDIMMFFQQYCPERRILYNHYYLDLYKFLYVYCTGVNVVTVTESIEVKRTSAIVSQLELPFDLNPAPGGWTH